jgi:hypothetical protein
MSERTLAIHFWEMALSANWSTHQLRLELQREPGVTPVGEDFRFPDGSRFKFIDDGEPARYAPDEECYLRREQHRATAIEIAQQKAAGG